MCVCERERQNSVVRCPILLNRKCIPDTDEEHGDDGEVEVEELEYRGKTFNVSMAYSPLHKDSDSLIWEQVRVRVRVRLGLG